MLVCVMIFLFCYVVVGSFDCSFGISCGSNIFQGECFGYFVFDDDFGFFGSVWDQFGSMQGGEVDFIGWQFVQCVQQYFSGVFGDW